MATTSPAKIRQLDPHVANQIAAGEVVERPSSVVKELLENSLDAGATAITLHLDEGGRARIRVVDDGHGMGPEDALLAFARHATSKITDAAELMRIGSYGFRGEALASILSVARVTLTSRRAIDELGVRVTGGGDAALTSAPVSAPVGTDLCIDELFFNVPARQKFLRTAATELGHVLRLVDAAALARPDVSWTLVHQGKTLCDYPRVASLEARARAVFDSELTPRLFTFAATEDYAVEGLLSDPQTTRGSPSGLTFLVDGRPVRDKTLQHAVVQAYGTLLDRRRYPVGVVHLRCPPGTVDVNVHPAKTEVRFVSSQAVHRAVGRAVRAMLAATPWLQPSLLSDPPAPYRADAAGAPGSEGPGAASAGSLASWEQPHRQRASQRPPSVASGRDGDPSWRSSVPPASSRAGAHAPRGSWPVASARAASTTPTSARSANAPPVSATPAVAASAAQERASTAGSPLTDADAAAPPPRYVGQVGRSHLVLDTPAGVVFLDQHAAHERALQLQFARQAAGLPRQRLLIPRVVALGPMAAATLLGHDALAEALGFELAPAGERSVMVRAAPEVLRADQLEPALRSLATALVDGTLGADLAAQRHAACAALACQAAVRAGDAITPAWAQWLLATLAGVDLSGFRPHGAPAQTLVGFEALTGVAPPSERPSVRATSAPGAAPEPELGAIEGAG